MNILLVTDAWHPQVNGVVRTLVNVIGELKRRGHNVITVTPQDHVSVPMPTYPEIRLSLTTARPMRKLLADAAPDAVHIATEGPLGLAARKACLQLGWRFSTSYHTRFPEYLNARLPVPVDWTYGFLRRFHNAGNGCLVATRSMAQELRKKGFNNLVAWTRGVDHELFNPAHRRENPQKDGPYAGLERPVFLNVGRIATEKNIDAFLALDLPGTKVVVGDGPDLPKLKAKYPGAVFPGVHKGVLLAEHYANADVFVFPSLTDTFGNVILEALSCGLPVAGFPVPGPIDILTDPACGVVDADLRRAALCALDLDRAAARRHALGYTWQACAGILLSVLKTNLREAA
ncbi:glycosyltransferase family 4 protein [Salaquimonas pukyongi]|uniref:glycosyltransferase family 4 protein n=1 Tax=Salaquimonas pukyongi TaxID=2712698 RepID=UPI00096B8972|nr:glycosyltransferase family 1 protein [Salaquimonas pukyongi]